MSQNLVYWCGNCGHIESDHDPDGSCQALVHDPDCGTDCDTCSTCGCTTYDKRVYEEEK